LSGRERDDTSQIVAREREDTPGKERTMCLGRHLVPVTVRISQLSIEHNITMLKITSSSVLFRLRLRVRSENDC
jgi:hypothetical protein